MGNQCECQQDPWLCKCDLALFAPSRQDIERYLRGTGLPLGDYALDSDAGTEEAEAFLFDLAEGYSQTALDATPPTWTLADTPELGLFTSSLLSRKLMPAYVFRSYRPGGWVDYGDIVHAAWDHVLCARKVLEGQSWTVFRLLAGRTECWDGDERSARERRRF